MQAARFRAIERDRIYRKVIRRQLHHSESRETVVVVVGGGAVAYAANFEVRAQQPAQREAARIQRPVSGIQASKRSKGQRRLWK